MVLTAAPTFADAGVEAAIKQGNELWKARKFAEAGSLSKAHTANPHGAADKTDASVPNPHAAQPGNAAKTD